MELNLRMSILYHTSSGRAILDCLKAKQSKMRRIGKKIEGKKIRTICRSRRKVSLTFYHGSLITRIDRAPGGSGRPQQAPGGQPVQGRQRNPQEESCMCAVISKSGGVTTVFLFLGRSHAGQGNETCRRDCVAGTHNSPSPCQSFSSGLFLRVYGSRLVMRTVPWELEPIPDSRLVQLLTSEDSGMSTMLLVGANVTRLIWARLCSSRRCP